MWKTAIFLIVTLVLLPVPAFYFDDPLTDLQRTTLLELTWVYLGAAILCFIVSTITKNYSQVDKLWSVIPIAYVWIAAARADLEPRMILMASLVTIWGVRLTFNFARRGGYIWPIWAGEEDYRWAVVRARPEFSKQWAWMLFNLFFVSLYQMGLILLFTLPIVKSMGGGPLGIADYIIAAWMLFFIVIETVADQQQWVFQKEKYRKIHAGEKLVEPYSKGFVHRGLWGIVRHPNYASEQAIWITFYGFSIIATGNILNWSITGAVLLVVLFKSSSDLSEGITAGKYPDYKLYQRKVPRFVPFTKW